MQNNFGQKGICKLGREKRRRVRRIFMFEIYVKLQLRVFPFGHCSIRRKRQSKQFMPDLTLFCSLAVRPTLRMRNIVFALHPGRKAYKFIFSYFIFIQSGCLCNKKRLMHTHTHTQTHIYNNSGNDTGRT